MHQTNTSLPMDLNHGILGFSNNFINRLQRLSIELKNNNSGQCQALLEVGYLRCNLFKLSSLEL